MIPRLVASLALLGTTTAAAQAQTTEVVHLTPQPESRVWVAGTSTLHAFTCTSTELTADVTVARVATASSDALTRPLLATEVTVPARALKCGHGNKMDDNMYKTLRADTYPTIRYTLGTADVIAGSTREDSITVRAVGRLTIVDREQPVTMDVRVQRASDGAFRGRGSVQLRLSDFGIKPPSFMLGTIKVGDSITVGFDVLLSSPTAVAAKSGAASR
jgi:polyisoprenoid-binding protein YceI